jgi:hypothetical protein
MSIRAEHTNDEEHLMAIDLAKNVFRLYAMSRHRAATKARTISAGCINKKRRVLPPAVLCVSAFPDIASEKASWFMVEVVFSS